MPFRRCDLRSGSKNPHRFPLASHEPDQTTASSLRRIPTSPILKTKSSGHHEVWCLVVFRRGNAVADLRFARSVPSQLKRYPPLVGSSYYPRSPARVRTGRKPQTHLHRCSRNHASPLPHDPTATPNPIRFVANRVGSRIRLCAAHGRATSGPSLLY